MATCDLCHKADPTVEYCSKCSHWLCYECRHDYKARLAAFLKEKVLGREI